MRKRVNELDTDDSKIDKQKHKTVSNARIPDFLVPFIALDKEWTSRLAVCAGSESILAALRPYMVFLEISCHGIPWIVGSLALLFYCETSWTKELLVNLVAALLIDVLAVGVLKAIFRRGRPAHNRDDMVATVKLDAYSFPSGHASRAVMVTLILVHKCGIFLSLLLGSFLVVWSVAVSLSRILLGRHHVGDVVAGVILGYIQYILIVDWLWLGPDAAKTFLWFFDVDTDEPV